MDKGGFLLPAPALQLHFTCNGFGHVLIALEPDQAVAVVIRREAVTLLPLVLKHTLVQVAGYADVDRAAAACNDVGEVASLVITRMLAENDCSVL